MQQDPKLKAPIASPRNFVRLNEFHVGANHATGDYSNLAAINMLISYTGDLWGGL